MRSGMTGPSDDSDDPPATQTPHDDVSGPVARVQEVDSAAAVVVLKIRVPGRTSFVIVGATRLCGDTPRTGLLRPEARKAHWGARLPQGAQRTRTLDAAVVGARVIAVTPTKVLLEHHGRTRTLEARGGRVVLLDHAAHDATTDHGDEGALEALGEEQQRALETRGERLARALGDEAFEVARLELARAVDKATARVVRRVDAIDKDLAKIAEAQGVASRATWLIAEAKRARRGATELVVMDWSTGEGVPLRIALDPSVSPIDQVEAMFKRAKRLRLGARVAEERLAQAHDALEGLRRARKQLESASDLPMLVEIGRSAKQAAPRDMALSGTPTEARREQSKGGPGRRTPYRTFHAQSGTSILVGKGGVDNDALTLHVARPHDLWLHAKDRAGAHVIVPLRKGHTCPAEDLVEAAHLAAHFSEARDETLVHVQYTHKRYLRKPKGSPPGFVVVDREKVLALRVAQAAIRALLEREVL